MRCSQVTTQLSRKDTQLLNKSVVISVLKKLMSGRAKVTQQMILKQRFTKEEADRDLNAIQEAVQRIERCTCQKEEDYR